MNMLSINVQILFWQYLYQLLKIRVHTLSQVIASYSLDSVYMLIGYTGKKKSAKVILMLG